MDFLKSKPVEGYFNSLDGLRALAIILVVVNHFVVPLPQFFEFIRSRGHLGVEIFFAVSGFLVMRSYHVCFFRNAGNAKKTLGEFYTRRGLRIFFPFYFSLLGIFALSCFVPSLGGKIWSIKNILVSFPLYFYNYAKPFTDGNVPGVLNIMWSLAFEEQFYLLLGLCCVFLQKRLGKSFFILAGVSVFVRFVTVFYEPNISFNRLQFETHMRLDSILLGCVGYIYFEKISLFLRNKSLARFGVYLGAFFAFYFGGVVVSPLEIALSFTFTSIFFTGLVLVVLIDSGGVVSKVLGNSLLVKVGKVSYEIYLIHQVINAVLVKAGVSNFPIVYGSFLIVLSCGISFAWFTYINNPVQKRLREKFMVSKV